jgi:glycosyltransferase involved in cell wall biosynthesis
LKNPDLNTEANYFTKLEKIDITNDKNISRVSSSVLSSEKPRILMVSPEYPPVNGGVGRYTYNLVNELKRQGLEVYVACDNRGKGDFVGLSTNNIHNSEILLDLVNRIRPDIVHIQYEPGLYGLALHSLRPDNIHSTIDLFYNKCKIPIITTFHSEYDFRQWMRIPQIKKNKKQSSLILEGDDIKNYKLLSSLIDLLDNTNLYWKYLINFKSFQNQNKKKLLKSNCGIVFSNYMKTIIGTKRSNDKKYSSKIRLLYHGAEAANIVKGISKESARARFNLLPRDKIHRIALAFGFMTIGKGWDILGKMRIPDNWTIVINSSVNHSTGERIRLDNITDTGNKSNANSIVNLNHDYLSEEDLSTLFLASDTVLLPYKITSGSGVMFDALGHGIPFIASDLPFFKEFASKGLGITAKRTPNAFTEALLELDNNYDKYKHAVERFKENLKWATVARNHIELYNTIVSSTKVVASSKINMPIARSLADTTSTPL